MIAATLSIEAASRQIWDAVVIGSGIAGAFAARELTLHGAKVLLVERKNFPRRKVCGACLNGQALSILSSSGLKTQIDELEGVPLHEFQLFAIDRNVTFPLAGGIAVSRDKLDAALLQAAIHAGVAFLPGVAGFPGPLEGDRRTVRLVQRGSSAKIAAKVILVAGGLGCLDGQPEMETVVSRRGRVGAGCTLEDAPPVYTPGSIWMGVGRGGYVGLVRVEKGHLNIAGAFDRSFIRESGTPGRAATRILHWSGLPEIPELEQADWQGTISLTRHMAAPAGERLFVVGDAAGYVEPFTGEGMAWALASAQLVVPLVLEGIDCWNSELCREWQKQLKHLLHGRQKLCQHIAIGLRHPWLISSAMWVLSNFPTLAVTVMNKIHSPLPISEAGRSLEHPASPFSRSESLT